MSHRSQQGFTLIELVVVITILGILAAVALPRFTDLQTQARVAKVTTMMSAVRAAASNMKAAAVAAGQNCAAVSGGTVSVENATITLINCYPTADVAGIIMASNHNQIPDIWYGGGAVGALAGSRIDFQVMGAPVSGRCAFSYTAPNATAATPVLVPTYNIDTSGC